MLKGRAGVIAGLTVMCGAAAGVLASMSAAPASGASAMPPASQSPIAGQSAARSATPNQSTQAAPAPQPTASSSLLSATDVNLVNAVGPLLASAPGTRVSVVRARGAAVWNAVAPDATTPDVTPTALAHNFLLATATENVAQTGYHAAPGVPAPVVGEVQIVIDESTGQVLEITRIPRAQLNTPSALSLSTTPAELGTPTTVTLSSASFAN